MLECTNYGTEKCKNCSQGQQTYCNTLHAKVKNGTYNLLDDYWDYINSVIDDDDDDY